MKFLKIAAVCGVLGLSLAIRHPARANDHIFPAAPAARASIDVDSHGFLINGKRTFIVSAGMEYARVPRALWRDRLLRLKRAGFNCVEMYNFWNWHEPQEGKFDFSGDHDLNAYLKLVHQMGMYAICRVGPYYCAEWDFGGYPLWLRFKPGVRVREDNPQFEAAVGKFFDKLIPIVAANQINRGGSVILVQLENEHPQGWGTEMPNGYFRFLRDKAVSLGLQVPYFFSGLHHGGDPMGNRSGDDPTRPNPWFTTEFWSVWFNQYGPKPGDAATFARRTWQIIAHGGNGYNYYMAHGGSNFGYTNNNEDAASYDYGAAVGQTGDLRPMYYAFKRAAWFARSFQDILENSQDATEGYRTAATNAAVRVTARKSPAGTILFLDNPSGSPVQTQINAPQDSQLPISGSLTLAPGEIMPIARDFSLAPGVTLTWAPTRILGIVPQGDTTTLVIYGQPGSPAELHFTVPPTAAIGQGASDLKRADPTTLVLNTQFAAGPAAEYAFTVGPQRIRILAVSDALADRTWFVDAGNQMEIVCGPEFVGDASFQNGSLRLTAERPWQDATDLPTLVYGATDPPLSLQPQSGPTAHPATLTLSPWQAKDAAQAAEVGYDDHGWLTSPDPLQMGADGDLTADAWYRAKVQAPTTGSYTLQFGSVRDRLEAFVDGVPVPQAHATANGLPLDLTAGPHTLALFTAHDGRDKLAGYLGPVDAIDAKGLTGPARLVQFAPGGGSVTGWRARPVTNGADTNTPPAPDAAGWTDYQIGDDAFNNQPGLAWFETQITMPPGGAAHALLHFDSVDDNGTVFVNGKQVFHHEGWNDPFDVPLDGTLHDGSNTVAVLVQNTASTGGIAGPVTLTRLLMSEPVTGWKLRGGPGDPLSGSGWQSLGAGDRFHGPAFFRATFTTAPPPAVGPHPIWRVVTTGLGHGSIWVNGHNLGRYPEKIPINSLYVPECWLDSGKNTVVIYDEDGHRPDQVTVSAEAAASRDVIALAPAK